MDFGERIALLSRECEGPALLDYKFLKKFLKECCSDETPLDTRRLVPELCGEVDRVNSSFVQAENRLLVDMPRFLSGAMDECAEADFVQVRARTLARSDHTSQFQPNPSPPYHPTLPQATHHFHRVGVANYLAALKITKKYDKAMRSTSTLFWEDDARSPALAAMFRHLLAQPFVISLESSLPLEICLHHMHESSPGSSAAGSLNSRADAQNAMFIRNEAATSSPTAACRGLWRQRDSRQRVPRRCADTRLPLC